MHRKGHAIGSELAVSVFIGKGLEADGKIVLYGIYFDSGKAELKAESKPQLEQMAARLKQQAALRVFIVGHSDNQGGLDANVALSQQRAQAVVGGAGEGLRG